MMITIYLDDDEEVYTYITSFDAGSASGSDSRSRFLEHPCKVLRYLGTDLQLAYSQRCRTSHILVQPLLKRNGQLFSFTYI